MNTQHSIEVQGLIFPSSEETALDHSAFLQELHVFLQQHGWTFSGSTRKSPVPVPLLPDSALQAEAAPDR